MATWKKVRSIACSQTKINYKWIKDKKFQKWNAMKIPEENMDRVPYFLFMEQNIDVIKESPIRLHKFFIKFYEKIHKLGNFLVVQWLSLPSVQVQYLRGELTSCKMCGKKKKKNHKSDYKRKLANSSATHLLMKCSSFFKAELSSQADQGWNLDPLQWKQSLNHWNTREFSEVLIFKYIKISYKILMAYSKNGQRIPTVNSYSYLK